MESLSLIKLKPVLVPNSCVAQAVINYLDINYFNFLSENNQEVNIQLIYGRHLTSPFTGSNTDVRGVPFFFLPSAIEYLTQGVFNATFLIPEVYETREEILQKMRKDRSTIRIPHHSLVEKAVAESDKYILRSTNYFEEFIALPEGLDPLIHGEGYAMRERVYFGLMFDQQRQRNHAFVVSRGNLEREFRFNLNESDIPYKPEAPKNYKVIAAVRIEQKKPLDELLRQKIKK